MEAHVYPNEGRFRDEVNKGDRWQPIAIVEDAPGKGAR